MLAIAVIGLLFLYWWPLALKHPMGAEHIEHTSVCQMYVIAISIGSLDTDSAFMFTLSYKVQTEPLQEAGSECCFLMDLQSHGRKIPKKYLTK